MTPSSSYFACESVLVLLFAVLNCVHEQKYMKLKASRSGALEENVDVQAGVELRCN